MPLFREGLRALTTRGRAFVAGGITAAVCGLVLGERDLVRIGALVSLLPVLTVALVVRTGHHLSVLRTVAPRQIEAGQAATVRLDLRNLGARTGLLLVEEQLGWALGQRPRFVVDGLRAGGMRQVEYPVRAETRGVYDLGPLRIRVADPFGMLALERIVTEVTPLVVVPVVEPLPPIGVAGAWTGSGENRPRPYSVGAAADVAVREYRTGDDLRRVHWRSTARTGELMVRQEEQPWESRCTVFLDNRACAHRGTGPDSSLERAVAATASIAVHLTRAGFQVRLVSAADLSTGREDVSPLAWHDGEYGAQIGLVLEQLAALPTSTVAELGAAWLDEATSPGSFIGVFGALTDRDRSRLARMHVRATTSYAVVLDVDSWTSAPDPSATVASKTWMHQRGWKASTLPRHGSLQTAWLELGR